MLDRVLMSGKHPVQSDTPRYVADDGQSLVPCRRNDGGVSLRRKETVDFDSNVAMFLIGENSFLGLGRGFYDPSALPSRRIAVCDRPGRIDMWSRDATQIDFFCKGIDSLAPPHISHRCYPIGKKH